MPTRAGSRSPASAASAAAELAVRAQTLGDLPADRVDGVQRGRRLLEDHRHVGAAQLAQALPRAPPRRRSRRRRRRQPSRTIPRRRGGLGQQAEDRLARSRSCRCRTRRRWRAPRPGRTVEADAVDGLDVAAVGGEGDLEVRMSSDGTRWRPAGGRALERAPASSASCGRRRRRLRRSLQPAGSSVRPVRRVVGHRPSLRHAGARSRGSARSFRLSPTSVMPSTASTMARPGNSAVHQMPLVTSDERLVEVVAPLGRGRRLDAEAEEAEAGEGEDAPREQLRVKISGRVRVALRSTCRNMMRGVLAPTTLADSTYASALIRTVSARITRKYCGMNTTVIEIAAARMPPRRARLAAADHDRRRRWPAAATGRRRSRRR